ncbi:MAG: glutathione S-transferase family protein [Pseudomonadota bacterium]
MPLTVYSISGAPRGWRVLLALEIKEIEYDLHYLEGSEGEHRAPEFRQLNPHGKVPVVVADGVARRESLALLGWLDRRYPDRPLFGSRATETAQIWETTTLLSDYLLEATNDVVSPVFNGDGTPPAKGSAEAKELNAAVQLLRVEHRLLEEILGDRRFLCGDEPTAADAVAYPEIARIMRALVTRPDVMATIGFAGFDERFPVLAAWRGRMEALPGFARTCPPHWRSSTAVQ